LSSILEKNPPQNAGAEWLYYPWLDERVEPEQYLKPLYYQKLLKPYRSKRQSDLDHFRRFLSSRIAGPSFRRVLEFGPGPGRATDVAFGVCSPEEVVLVDRSERMLDHCRQRYRERNGLRFVCEDAVTYCGNAHGQYDLIYSLWSLSHSVHQRLRRSGDSVLIRNAILGSLRRVILNGLADNGWFYLIHFDSQSDEQVIALKQRVLTEPFLSTSLPSPSKQIMDALFASLAIEGEIEFEIKHVIGEPIVYRTLAEALETYMNFHLEGRYNAHPLRSQVLFDLAQDIGRYRAAGRYEITPAWYVYTAHRVRR
jgi:SAM-dependent methyltransferase